MALLDNTLLDNQQQPGMQFLSQLPVYGWIALILGIISGIMFKIISFKINLYLSDKKRFPNLRSEKYPYLWNQKMFGIMAFSFGWSIIVGKLSFDDHLRRMAYYFRILAGIFLICWVVVAIVVFNFIFG